MYIQWTQFIYENYILSWYINCIMGEDKIRKDSADAAAIYNSYYYLYARGIYTTFFLYSYCRIYVFHRTYLYLELYIEKKNTTKILCMQIT